VFRVAVDPIRSEENLEVPEQMTDDEKDQNDSRDRHDHFLADCGMVENGLRVHKLSAAKIRD
jgi:hypothetical protein